MFCLYCVEWGGVLEHLYFVFWTKIVEEWKFFVICFDGEEEVDL